MEGLCSLRSPPPLRRVTAPPPATAPRPQGLETGLWSTLVLWWVPVLYRSRLSGCIGYRNGSRIGFSALLLRFRRPAFFAFESVCRVVVLSPVKFCGRASALAPKKRTMSFSNFRRPTRRENIIRVPAAALLPGALRQQAAGLRACARHHHEVHSGSRTARQGRVARTARHGGSPERRGRVSPHIGFIHADERRRQRFSRDRALTGSARWWSHGRAAQNIVPLTAVARFELYPCMNNICMPRLPMSRSRIAATVAGCVTQAAVPDACART